MFLSPCLIPHMLSKNDQSESALQKLESIASFAFSCWKRQLIITNKAYMLFLFQGFCELIILFALQVGYKRKRFCTPEDITKGAARGHRFLQEFSALPLDQMDMKQAMEHLNKLRTELENDASNFPWLQQFFWLEVFGGIESCLLIFLNGWAKDVFVLDCFRFCYRGNLADTGNGTGWLFWRLYMFIAQFY